jgi:hypothetical protein
MPNEALERDAAKSAAPLSLVVSEPNHLLFVSIKKDFG